MTKYSECPYNCLKLKVDLFLYEHERFDTMNDMENNLTIITHVKKTKKVILKTVLDMVDVDDEDAVINEVIEYMAAVYGAKYILMIDNPQYQKYKDYNGMFFVNKDNYFEVTFDNDNRNECHVFIGNF